MAVHPGVREALLQLQRHFANQDEGAVMDGRDIGTVIAPHAHVKLFVTATPEVRAQRRWKQLKEQGEDVTLDQVLADIRQRDARDAGRSAAPLIKAVDADLLDTSEMTIDDAFREALRLVELGAQPPKGVLIQTLPARTRPPGAEFPTSTQARAPFRAPGRNHLSERPLWLTK